MRRFFLGATFLFKTRNFQGKMRQGNFPDDISRLLVVYLCVFPYIIPYIKFWHTFHFYNFWQMPMPDRLNRKLKYHLETCPYFLEALQIDFNTSKLFQIFFDLPNDLAVCFHLRFFSPQYNYHIVMFYSTRHKNHIILNGNCTIMLETWLRPSMLSSNYPDCRKLAR